jgi:hypothetical protein
LLRRPSKFLPFLVAILGRIWRFGVVCWVFTSCAQLEVACEGISREYGAVIGQLTSSCHHLLYLGLPSCSRALLLPCHLDLTCSPHGNRPTLARRSSSHGRIVLLSWVVFWGIGVARRDFTSHGRLEVA